MHVKGWVKSSLLDYPGRIAASLFCGSCNFRCPNCHNSHLVLYPNDYPDVPESEIWDCLSRRRGLLDGVVISGGEPTLQSDLIPFARRVKDVGYLVKLDTNGYLPDVLAAAIEARVVDYVAMDVKAPLAKYSLAAGLAVDSDRIGRSIELLREGRVAYEFRTTVVPGILSEEDVREMARLIAGPGPYYLQQFVPQDTIDPKMMECVPYLPQRLEAMADLAREWIDQVYVRGI